MKRMMMLALVLMLYAQLCLAQSANDYYAFRAYNQSLVLLDGDDITANKAVFSDYGAIVNSTTSSMDLMNYTYQSQEYSRILGLFFFPRRIFQSHTYRFFQPDPKSQYFSPYLFVGADPINFVDLDGEEGKALILYESEENGGSTAMPKHIRDVMSSSGDNYVRPLSDLANRSMEKIPEWNGNVFIFAHMGSAEGKEVAIEKAGKDYDFKSNFWMGDIVDLKDGSKELYFGADQISRDLHSLSLEEGVPLKNIVAGGCQGSYLAERMHASFDRIYTRRKGLKKGLKTRFKGLKKGRFLQVRTTTLPGKERETHLYVNRDYTLAPFSKEDEVEHKAEVLRAKQAGEMPGIYNPEIKQEEIGDFLSEGRVPARVSSEYNEFILDY